jgi:hypothetical protein
MLGIKMQKKNMVLKVEMTSNNVPTYLKKRSNPLTKSSRTKSSYTIPKGPLKERHGEQAKAKINASQFKVTSISRLKSSTKGGRSTSNKWMKKAKDFRSLVKWGCMCAQS